MADFESFLMAHYRWIQDYCSSYGPGDKLDNFKRILDDFPCSFALDVAGLNYAIMEELGNKAWSANEKGVVTRKNIPIMERQEYPQFIKEPVEFLAKVALPRLYSADLTQEVLWEKSKEYHEAMGEEKLLQGTLGEMGYPVRAFLNLGAPLDILADFLRGTKGLLTDLHSEPQWVDQACEVLTELLLRQAKVHNQLYGTRDMLLPLHLPTLLSRKDYQQFYHPTYSALLERMLDAGYRILVMVEGNGDRFVDLLAQIDSPDFLMHFENTDLSRCVSAFKGKKTRITGFYPTHLLKYAGEKECLDKAREMKGILGGDVSYVFSTNKVLLSKGDADVKILKKVYEYFSLD